MIPFDIEGYMLWLVFVMFVLPELLRLRPR